MRNQILVIEDDPGIRANILDLLEAEGYEATGAADGLAGIAAAISSPPDLVLCDVAMPVLDGYEVLRALGSNDRTQATQFVFLSAKADPSDVRRGIALGADAYVVKPFTRSALLDAIRARLGTVRESLPPPEATGAIGERFVLGAPIGRGAMGLVYSAIDRSDGSEVALKVLPAGAAEDYLRFAREQEVLSRLPKHPAIIEYLAHGTGDDGRPWIAMRRLHGEPLSHALGRGPLEIEAAVALGKRLLDALAHAHDRGVVHRDVKPGNLFLEAGRVEGAVLLDFGLARTRSPSVAISGPGTLVGTALYMAPEQVRCGAIDGRADVYSVGCVLYECLTGRPPFEGSSLPEVLVQHLTRTPASIRAIRPSVPERVARAIEQMLAREPDQRPRDASRAAALLSG